jgi:hypothetical protein
MSAHIVGKAHIDYLVAAALYGPQGHHPNWSSYFWNPETSTSFDPRHDPDALGRMLWAENYASVAYRYQDSTTDALPGPSDFDLAEVYIYHFGGRRSLERPSAVAILKAIDGLEYQSCEHRRWRDSAAYAFCQSLRKRLIATLPGYDTADTWSIA